MDLSFRGKNFSFVNLCRQKWALCSFLIGGLGRQVAFGVNSEEDEGPVEEPSVPGSIHLDLLSFLESGGAKRKVFYY